MLDAFAKARTMKQAKSMMVAAITKDLEERFGDRTGKMIHLRWHYGITRRGRRICKGTAGLFPATGEIVIAPLSLSVSCHIGPGSLAVACSKVIE